jgi:hypothetical protein
LPCALRPEPYADCLPLAEIGLRQTVDGQKKQYEDLNPKFQIPISKTKAPCNCIFFVWVIGSLEFGIYLEFGACDLEFKSY